MFVVMIFFERVDGARTNSTVPRQVMHVASGTRCFLDGAGFTRRGQGVIADGRGNSGVSQQK